MSDVESRLTRIEHKIDRILELTLSSLPRLIEEWPSHLSTRAMNVIRQNSLTLEIVRSNSKWWLQKHRNCGPGTANEIWAASRELRP